MATQKPYKHFLVDKPLPYVAHVQINRPKKLNAFYEEMWLEFKVVFDTLSLDPEVRAIILSGAGDRAFTAGLDVELTSQQGILQIATTSSNDVARKAVMIKRHVEEFQSCISSVEKCEKRRSPSALTLNPNLRSTLGVVRASS
jgi:delta(3,5)-delta(2,4)-dienoyl-CoA isomerase